MLLIYDRVREAAERDAICQQTRRAANETLSQGLIAQGLNEDNR